jgi:prepilin-type N-terminal cleavage/methylation domain-containing protein
VRSRRKAQGIRHKAQGARREAAFTLIELLVVVAITAVLLALIFAPMMSGFQFLQMGRAKVQAYDTARNALETMSREVSASAYVFNPPSRWDHNTNAFVEDRSRIDFLLPGRSLPELPEGMILTYPVIPTGKVVTYFIGLKDPSYKTPDGQPGGYANSHVNDNELRDDNFYWLFRAEFDPFHATDEDGNTNPCYDPKCDPGSGQYDPNPSNWDWRRREWLDWSGPNQADFTGIPSIGGTSDPATIAANIVARRQYMRSRGEITALVPLYNCDMVGSSYNPSVGYIVSYGLEFLPTDVVSEVLKPLDNPGGESYSPDTPPTTYATKHGHWTGALGDGSYFYGAGSCGDPRIEVYSGRQKVFDSADSNYRERTLSFDSERGQVVFSEPRGPSDPNKWSLGPDNQNRFYNRDSGGDMYYYRIFDGPPGTNPTSRLVESSVQAKIEILPSMEVIELVPASRNPLPYSVVPRHGLGELPQTFILQRIEGGTYNGGYVIKLDREFVDDLLSRHSMCRLVVDYQTQDNLYSDVVRASYGSNEVLTARLNIRVYDNVSAYPANVVVTNKLVSYNLRR